MPDTQLVPCSNCGAQYPLTQDYIAQFGGQQTACRQCGQPFVIPREFAPISSAQAAGAPVPVLSYRNAAADPGGVGVWSEGRVIVASDNATFPARCVKCNAPADGPPYQRKLFWHHPAIYLVLLFNIIIYAIVALCVRKKGIVYPSMCKRHKRRRMAFIIGGWLSIPASVVCFVLAGESNNSDISACMIILGIVVLLGGLITGVIGSRIVVPSRIDGGYLWLKGAGREFLASLPDVHGGAPRL